MYTDFDIISIENVEIYAYHGVYKDETDKGQRFIFSARLYLDMGKCSRSDGILDTVHYGNVAEELSTFLTENVFALMETAVTRAAMHIMSEYPMLEGIELTLQKPDAPIELEFETVSVSRSFFRHDLYIGLGSNIGDKKGYLDMAVSELLELEKNEGSFAGIKVSEYIETKPYGRVDQDDFLNAVLYAKTLLSPYEVLDILSGIEEKAKRERKEHWGPRTLDLDILFYDDLVMCTDRLTIPHPDLHNREFVLRPLEHIAPHLRHPLLLKTPSGMLKDLRREQDSRIR
ncbi:MAG: 2-amino-4-hydroxy-6-hydroxymethyldihydropteridine diphosphokinase [Lachnospiraceae bacterium]|nr:2-amino-4-hydroxy-6-hydroxymethyldihydropteridine diphosphokinase [Lachnospiraceae bacterium]